MEKLSFVISFSNKNVANVPPVSLERTKEAAVKRLWQVEHETQFSLATLMVSVSKVRAASIQKKNPAKVSMH